MAKATLNLGSHLSVAGGLENALKEGRRIGCGCVQLFVTNQRQWVRKDLTDEQVMVFLQERKKSGLNPVVAHSSYLINLAAVDEATYRRSMEAMADEYNRCCRLGIDYMVLHPGAHRGQGEDKGLAQIVESLTGILKEKGGCMILLETTAGQGSCVGHRFEHLRVILDGVDDERVGVCMDTSHVFAAGYDLVRESGYRKTMQEFGAIVGWDRLKVVHVNDSKAVLGSRVDRHEHIGKGQIGKAGFWNLLHDKRINRLPLILETPKGTSPGGRDLDRLNMAALRRIYNSEIATKSKRHKVVTKKP